MLIAVHAVLMEGDFTPLAFSVISCFEGSLFILCLLWLKALSWLSLAMDSCSWDCIKSQTPSLSANKPVYLITRSRDTILVRPWPGNCVD